MIIHDYTKSWADPIHEILWGRNLRIQSVYGKLAFGGPMDNRKFFLRHTDDYIKSVGAKKVLELGSGIGINLLVLAILNPSVEKFCGIELTKQGVAISHQLVKNPPVTDLRYLTGLDEETILARVKPERFDIREGDIRKLPWPDKRFDFVFSMWVMEQLPRSYRQAFMEAKRVLSGHALFMEEFAEAQQNIFQKIHLRNVDYFHSSYKEVEKLGFDVLRFEPMPIHKIKFSYGSLFCRG